MSEDNLSVDFNKILEQTKKETREELLKEIQKLIVDEILICNQEGTPTSRLTSLSNKIK